MAEPGLGAGLTRELVERSWDRARSRSLDPERVVAPLRLDGTALREYRDGHPLAAALPVIKRLLVEDAGEDSGVLVAVGDAAGRLLWVDGDQRLKARAEGMLFVEGSDWSESTVGTSAPGTAIALDRGVRIDRGEHYAMAVQRWSCSAVPVHDLETGRLIGVVDITGGPEAAVPATLALVQASVAAVERELLIERLKSAAASPVRRPRPTPAAPARLEVLGRDTGVLHVAGRPLELSARHSEILTLLAWHPAGLSAEQLAEAVYGREDAVVTLRAELVRLRRRLEQDAPAFVPLTRPYRLEAPLDVDARNRLALLERGAHRAALAGWGTVLPGSSAPGIQAVRDELEAHLRESMLECASAETLASYASSASAIDDVEVWRTLLQLLPARSPRRAGVVAHLEELEAD